MASREPAELKDLQVLSDSDKRAIYDQGGAAALEEQEGFANINLDHLMLNVLMWEGGQKACFLCVLSLLLLEVNRLEYIDHS